MFWRSLFFLIFNFGIFARIFAQETPYYQPPEKRFKNHELVNMPNLSSKSISYYIGLTGGFKKSYNQDYLTSPFDVETNSLLTSIWEINLGQNLNDNLLLETGLSHQKSSLSTTFYNIFRQPVIITNEKEQYFIPMRIKKRVLTIDRITKNAFVNLGIGVAYNVNKPNINEELAINFQPQKNPEPTDFKKLTIDKASKTAPFLFEAYAEIRGKISERVEVSVFVKSIFKNPKDLSNNFIVEQLNGETLKFGNFEKSMSISIGLQARLNSPKYLKYISNVE